MPSQVPLPQNPNASHPELVQTNFKPGSFTSYAVSLVSLPAGSHFCNFEQATPSSEATYATVQTGKDSHMNLNTDLLYTNHSCKPTLEFDVGKMEVRVARERDLKVGDKLTFFYPSTEWDMTQPFECNCNEQECLGRIDGAKNMDRAQLSKYWLNNHIEEMLATTSAK